MPHCQHILSTHTLRTLYRHTLSTHHINSLSQHIQSTHPINTPYQHTLYQIPTSPYSIPRYRPLGTPQTMTSVAHTTYGPDLVGEIGTELDVQLVQANAFLPKWMQIVDPGMQFSYSLVLSPWCYISPNSITYPPFNNCLRHWICQKCKRKFEIIATRKPPAFECAGGRSNVVCGCIKKTFFRYVLPLVLAIT